MGFGVKTRTDTLYSRGDKSRGMGASEYAIVFFDFRHQVARRSLLTRAIRE